MEQLLNIAGSREVYYWAVHGGPELDLLLFHRGRRVGIEFKFVDAPRLHPLMETIRGDLRLDRLWIVYPGEMRYSLTDDIGVLPLAVLAEALA